MECPNCGRADEIIGVPGAMFTSVCRLCNTVIVPTGYAHLSEIPPGELRRQVWWALHPPDNQPAS